MENGKNEKNGRNGGGTVRSDRPRDKVGDKVGGEVRRKVGGRNPKSESPGKRGGQPVLGVTMGDPAGVGPELCLRVLQESGEVGECVPVVFGDESVVRRLSRAGLSGPECRVVSLKEWERCGP